MISILNQKFNSNPDSPLSYWTAYIHMALVGKISPGTENGRSALERLRREQSGTTR